MKASVTEQICPVEKSGQKKINFDRKLKQVLFVVFHKEFTKHLKLLEDSSAGRTCLHIRYAYITFFNISNMLLIKCIKVCECTITAFVVRLEVGILLQITLPQIFSKKKTATFYLLQLFLVFYPHPELLLAHSNDSSKLTSGALVDIRGHHHGNRVAAERLNGVRARQCYRFFCNKQWPCCVCCTGML